MNNPEPVKIGRTRHDFRELQVIRKSKGGIYGKAASGLTNWRRFTIGLDLAYSITFPFRIQSEMIRKQQGSVVIETPNKGRMLG